MKKNTILCILSFIIIISNCGLMRPKWKGVDLSDEEIKTLEVIDVEEDNIKKLIVKPLYKFNEKELDAYLKYLYNSEFDLRTRVQHLARKCINQPYQIYLLGEFPFEIHDPDPLFNLNKSDCVVFSEHIYSMALSYDWESFFATLQRIRYKDGEISYITRNHYTEYDWDINNSWLVSDITRDLAGSRVKSVTSVYDKSLFFNRVGLNTYFAPDTFKWEYIPANSITPELLGSLKPGDFVNIVRGYDDNDVWVGHVGLITKNDDGTTNFLHSTNPRVKEEPIMDYLNRNLQKNEERRLHNQKARAYNQMLKEKNSNKKLKRTLPYFLGFKFLRLNDDPMWELFKIDGFGAPRVTIPSSY